MSAITSGPVGVARKVLEYSRDVLPVPSAVVRRALIASLPQVPIARPHQAPNYGSDLGVRASLDPRDYFVGTMDRLGINISVNTEATVRDVVLEWTDGVLTDSQLASQLDVLISYAGSWESAAALGAQALASSRVVGSHRALTYTASALSAIGSEDAGRVFLLAGSAPDATLPVKAMAGVRNAAWLIKRRSDFEAGRRRLAEVIKSVARSADNYMISGDDHRVLTAVCLNLRALTYARAGDLKTALETLSQARDLIQADRLVTVGEDERRRYSVQISVNIAQLYCKMSQVPAAVQLMSELSGWVREGHAGSVSEVLTLCGYTFYLAGDYSQAETLLSEAVVLLADEGAPSRIAMTRKIRAVCLEQLRKSAESAEVVRAIELDPLGFDEYELGRR